MTRRPRYRFPSRGRAHENEQDQHQGKYLHLPFNKVVYQPNTVRRIYISIAIRYICNHPDKNCLIAEAAGLFGKYALLPSPQFVSLPNIGGEVRLHYSYDSHPTLPRLCWTRCRKSGENRLHVTRRQPIWKTCSFSLGSRKARLAGNVRSPVSHRRKTTDSVCIRRQSFL